jgi:ribosomal protein L40E
MKVCDYCGRENTDDAVSCCECGTQDFKNPKDEAEMAEQSAEPEPSESELIVSSDPKVCEWCGLENVPSAVRCRECGTLLKSHEAEAPETVPQSAEPGPARWKFRKLTSDEMKLDLVTLVSCRSIVEADLVVGQLGSVGISAFIPDEFLAQAMAWNINAFGYVRVQVSPNDYERAKTFLLELSELAEIPEPGSAPNGGPAMPSNDSGVSEGPPSVS